MHDIQTATIERGNFLMLQTGAQLYTVRSYTQTIEDFICTIQKSLTSVIKPSSFPPFPNRLSRSRSVKFVTARAFPLS